MRFTRRALALAALALALPVCSQAQAQGVAGVGFNLNWQLGPGYRNGFETLPVSVAGLRGEVKEVAPADGNTLFLLQDGTVWSVGGDTYGQCGCGIRQSAITRPTQAKFPPGTVIVQIAAAGGHAMALSSTGVVYSWGGNLFGTLGNGTTTKGVEAPGDFSAVPLVVQLPGPARAIVAGGASDFAIMADGSLQAWGENKTGQLGDATTTERTRPVLARVSGIAQLTVGGIGGQGGHAIVILTSGAVLAWGADGQGQLGDGNTHTSVLPVQVRIAGPVASVSAAVSHSLAVMPDGHLQAWGSNQYGELGVPTTQRCTKQLLACSTTPAAIAGLSNVTQASANFGFSLAVSAGQALAWGWNQYGQLGNGTRTNSSLPGVVAGLSGVQAAEAGVHHSMFLLAGEGPPPTIALSIGYLSLGVAWRSTNTTERWTVGVRPVTKPAHGWTILKPSLPSSARSTTVGGLTAGVEYQVYVKNAGFGTRIVAGTPLP